MISTLKKGFVVLLAIAMLLTFAACGGGDEDPAPVDDPVITDPIAEDIDFSGTCWEAVKYNRYIYAEDIVVETKMSDFPVPYMESWSMKLFLYEDGTMWLQDVEGDCYSYMAVKADWTEAEKGYITLSNGIYLQGGMPAEAGELPEFTLVYDSEDPALVGLLAMPYYDGVIYFAQREMPADSKAFIPADIQGDWVLEGIEIEGDYTTADESGMYSELSFGRNIDNRLIADYYKYYYYDETSFEMIGVPTVVESDCGYFAESMGSSFQVTLDTSNYGLSNDYVTSESFCVFLADENTLILHYMAETESEPPMIATVYTYTRSF